MKANATKKTFSLPLYIAHRLDDISARTGHSQSNLVLQALVAYMHRFQVDGTLEQWMERSGYGTGFSDK